MNYNLYLEEGSKWRQSSSVIRMRTIEMIYVI